MLQHEYSKQPDIKLVKSLEGDDIVGFGLARIVDPYTHDKYLIVDK